MRGYIADDVVTEWLGQLVQYSVHASLHFAIPSMSDPTASEVFDAGYVRAPVTWQYINARTISNAGPLTFNLSASTTVVAVGLHKTSVAPEMQAYGEPNLISELLVSSAGRLTIPTGELVFGLV